MRSLDKPFVKLVFCGLFAALFLKLFVFSWDADWQHKFSRFHVPAYTFPAADLRGMQVAAHCGRLGYSWYGMNACQQDAAIVKQLYPDALVTGYNYPSWWIKAYAFFNDDSEHFLRQAWTLNTLLLLVAITSLACALNYRVLPLLLFSPITLLAVERGNIDGATLFLTFIPLLLLAGGIFRGFFLGIAGGLKIYPLFGLLALQKRRAPFVDARVMLGSLLALPFMIPSFLEIREILAGTSHGFAVAYGLGSINYAPWFSSHPLAAWIWVAAFLVFVVIALGWLWQQASLKAGMAQLLAESDEKRAVLLAVSLSIFLLTFFVFTSWAYRLIFLIPAFAFVSASRAGLARIMFWNMVVIFWAPMLPLPYGWVLQNLACMPLVPTALMTLYLALERESNPTASAA